MGDQLRSIMKVILIIKKMSEMNMMLDKLMHLEIKELRNQKMKMIKMEITK
jgi:hypothetical protein